MSAGVYYGDSGSPVFSIINAQNDVELRGILWGLNGSTMFVYSPIAYIEDELGPINTTIFISYINGTVKDSGTKEVLPRVIVSTTGASTMSDASGFYSLPVAPGTYPLTATYDIRYYTNSSITVSTVENAAVLRDIEMVKKPYRKYNWNC